MSKSCSGPRVRLAGKGKTMRCAVREFQNLDLWAHSFLGDVPLHDAFVIDLPGGGSGRTISDIHALLSTDEALKVNPLVASLVWFRYFLGGVLGWENDSDQFNPHSYLHRLDAADRARSLIQPGTEDGPFRLLNVLPGERLREVVNATVHAFLCEALRESDSGYRLYWGVYVKPVSRLTPVYMAVIAPFRRLAVYPAILGRIRKAWMSKYKTSERIAPLTATK